MGPKLRYREREINQINKRILGGRGGQGLYIYTLLYYTIFEEIRKNVFQGLVNKVLSFTSILDWQHTHTLQECMQYTLGMKCHSATISLSLFNKFIQNTEASIQLNTHPVM